MSKLSASWCLGHSIPDPTTATCALKVVVSAFENELGVQDPVGFWDPAGFTADGSVENFQRRRQTELKHGRISMLATMGYITPERLC